MVIILPSGVAFILSHGPQGSGTAAPFYSLPYFFPLLFFFSQQQDTGFSMRLVTALFSNIQSSILNLGSGAPISPNPYPCSYAYETRRKRD